MFYVQNCTSHHRVDSDFIPAHSTNLISSNGECQAIFVIVYSSSIMLFAFPSTVSKNIDKVFCVNDYYAPLTSKQL